MKMFGLIVMIFGVASAELIFDGACPAVKPTENFDLSGYAGTWYHIRKLPLVRENYGECAKAFYSLDGDTLKLKYSQVVNGEEIFVLGVANKAEDANNAAKLIVNINIEESVRVEPLWILATDYNSYAISYSCKYNKKNNTHKLSLWVLSRSKNLKDDSKTVVDSYLNSNFGYIDATKFVTNDLSEDACKFYASRVYSASAGQ